jgi:hypothetical protein
VERQQQQSQQQSSDKSYQRGKNKVAIDIFLCYGMLFLSLCNRREDELTK